VCVAPPSAASVARGANHHTLEYHVRRYSMPASEL
jgi:hypothetical protein